MHLNHTTIIRTAFVILLAAPFAAVSQATSYLYTDIGLAGGESFPFSLNDNGVVTAKTGYSLNNGSSFIWQDGVIHPLPPTPFSRNSSLSEAWDVNNSGVVVG